MLIRELGRINTADEMQRFVRNNLQDLTEDFFNAYVRSELRENVSTTAVEHRVSALVSCFSTLAIILAKEKECDAEAVKYFGLAAKAADALKNKSPRRDILVEQGHACQRLRRYGDAIKSWRAAAELCQRLGDGERQAEINNLLGVAYRSNWQFEQAIACDEAALQYYTQRSLEAAEDGQRFKITERIGFCHSFLGQGYSQTGSPKQALSHFKKSLRIARQQSNKESERDRLGNLARVYAVSGDKERAIERYLTARKITINDKKKDSRARMLIDMNLGSLYREINQLQNARTFYKEALESSRKLKDQINENRLLTSLGIVHRNLGKLRRACVCYERALQLAGRVSDEIGEADAAGHLGNFYYQSRQFEQALTHYDRALLIAQKMNDDVYVSRWTGNKANALAALGRFDEARKFYGRALKVAKRNRDKDHEYLWHYNVGMFYRRNGGNLEKAYRHFKSAIACLEELRRAVRRDDFSRSFGESRVLVYQAMVNTCLGLPGRKQETIGFIEKAKGYTLMRMMAEANITPGKQVPPDLRNKWQRLRAEQRLVESELLITTPPEESSAQTSPDWKDKQRRKLIHIRQRQAENYRAMAASAPLFSDVFNPGMVTVKNVQSHLKTYRRKTVLVEFYVTREQTNVFIASSDESEWDVIPVPHLTEQRLFQLCEDNWLTPYKRLFLEGDFAAWKAAIANIGQLLYEKLWQDLTGAINQMAPERLILIPHLGLHLLPLHLIAVPDHPKSDKSNNFRFLSELYEVVHAPSFRMLTHCRAPERKKHKPAGFCGISNPDGSLQFADIEVAAIANLFESPVVLRHEAATRRATLDEAARHAVLHFASHGKGATLPQDPLESGITIGDKIEVNGEEKHVRLKTKEIFQVMTLPESHAVVLSACETGMVSLDLGDDYIGLPAAFLKAGAPAVISSLWSVEDVSTALLMYQWYQNVFRGKMPRGCALNEARQWLRTLSGAGVKCTLARITKEIKKRNATADSGFYEKMLQALRHEKNRYSYRDFKSRPYEHPYYWAGFIISGDPE